MEIVRYLLSDGWWIMAGFWFAVSLLIKGEMGDCFSDYVLPPLWPLWLPPLLLVFLYEGVSDMFECKRSCEITSSCCQPFPKMMESDSGTLVLFSEPGKGVTLRQGTHCSTRPGDYLETWCMSRFRDTLESFTMVNN